jgi:flagellar motor switch protein FliN
MTHPTDYDPARTRETEQAETEAIIESWRDHLDLPVPLSVELGRTVLSAREVLDLDVNSIIQLQRSTGEGVDVFARDRLIARGEIIMIEDRTGVRVNEIRSRGRH